MRLFFIYKRDGKSYKFDLSEIARLLNNFNDEEITEIIDEIIDELVAAHQETVDMKEKKVTAEEIIEMISNGDLPSMDVLLKNKIRKL